jgi:dual specificity phosphatase 12
VKPSKSPLCMNARTPLASSRLQHFGCHAGSYRGTRHYASRVPSSTTLSYAQAFTLTVDSAMGKSRSATLCVAYMLSRSRGSDLTPTAALDAIKMARPVVEPNPGFMAQLELYHGMGCPEYIQAEPAYQRWQYQQEVELSVACGRAPDTIRFEDEAVPLASRSGSAAVHAANRLETPQTLGSEVEVRCRRCRRSLARTPYIVPHTPKPASATQAARAAQSGPIDSLDDELASDRTSAVANSPCAHIFLDPLSWMRPELEQGKLDGKLECPNEKCRTKVGQYAWQGMRCSCGQWVTPAISLARSRIDEVKARPVGPRQQSVPGKI